MTRIAKYFAVAVFVGTTGCASSSELAKVSAESAEAKRIAEQALNTANEARQTAQDADARSKRAEETVSRGFRKSMRK